MTGPGKTRCKIETVAVVRIPPVGFGRNYHHLRGWRSLWVSTWTLLKKAEDPAQPSVSDIVAEAVSRGRFITVKRRGKPAKPGIAGRWGMWTI
jgi:hypothetical protein